MRSTDWDCATMSLATACRIIFGSGYPMMPVDRSVAELAALGLPDDVLARWMHANAAAFLRLA